MSLKSRIYTALQIFTSLALAWLIAIIALSIYEYATHASGLSTHGFLAAKLTTDLIFWIRAFIPLLPGFILISIVSPHIARWTGIVLFIILTIGQTALMKYFSSALVPLGADLYGYSLHDIMQTAGASGSLHILDVVIVIVFIAALLLLLKTASAKPRIPLKIAGIIALIAAVIIITDADNAIPPKKFNTEYEANLHLNKLGFFLTQSKNHFFPPDQDVDIYTDDYAGVSQTTDTLATQFIYPDENKYPFYHLDSTRDVLSPFFSVTPHHPLPNIVIILVEGLGRAFTNKGAYLGNFTPFIDSLSTVSLYWKNFLSEGGRTFAVLPSVSGSLPFAKNGFLEMGSAMPAHLSLINTLRNAGYHTSFYYGGDAHFDNMDMLLQKEGIDELNDEKTFSASAGYTKLPAQNGFTWGYNDASLFKHWLDTRAQNAQPQLSIILTVSTHSPFIINDPATYEAKFQQRMDQLGFDAEAKASHQAYKTQYSSILYTDDALRAFFQAYAKRPDYNNTIFLITGDHRMPEIPMRTKIDRYHVPLMIYSPMLKRHAEFLSISTHYDITPSLIAFLHAAYDMPRPPAAQWMGAGIDTAASFRNIHAYPLMQTKTDLVDFVKGEYHLNNGQLFRLSADMNEEAINTPQPQVPNGFNTFLKKNEKLIAGSPLIPDSAIRHSNHGNQPPVTK